jgi:transmembrane sensor
MTRRRMEPSDRFRFNTQIYEEACEWLVEFRAGDADAGARRRFDAWLRKSPENLGAYLEIAAIWNEGHGLDLQRRYVAEELVSHAGREDVNVVPLLAKAAVGSEVPARRPRLAYHLTAAVFLVCLGFVLFAWYAQRATYATETAEQRSIVLSDGSTVELNSRSKMRVRITASERAVDLLAGQALFKVAKDAGRPFTVVSGATRVRAVGTSFDVYRKRSSTVVTVVEGRVAVGSAVARGERSATAPRDVLLDAGQQARVTSTRVVKSERADVSTATAWTQRQLVFESATLDEVVEEFNRYNDRQLVIEEGGPVGFHISGVFSSTDPASLVRFLSERRGLRVHETDEEILIGGR